MKAFFSLVTCLLIQAATSSNDVEANKPSPSELSDKIAPSVYAVNRKIILLCQFQALFTPEVTWLKDGSPLSNGSRFRITQRIIKDDSSMSESTIPSPKFPNLKNVATQLEIVKLRIEDSGLYSCAQSNSPTPGFPRKNFNIIAKDPDLIVLRVPLNQAALFLCAGTREASTKAIWLKNGSPLIDDPRYRILENVFENAPSTKLFESALKTFMSNFGIIKTEFEDSANYTCSSSNSANNPNLVYYQLIVEESKNVLTAKTHETTTFTCNVVALDSSLISWKKDGKPLPDNPRFRTFLTVRKKITNSNWKSLGIELITTTSKLQINDTQFEDSGIYTCITNNAWHNNF